MFTYYAPPQTDGAVPASGPRAGGTNVTVTGAGLGGAGLHVLCRFGEELSTHRASTRARSDALRPPRPAALPPATSHARSITLNGQQFTAARRPFIQYEPPQIDALPGERAGDVGETTITVRGNGLGFGRADDSETRRRCAFDGTDTGAATRIETAAGAALLCESPPALRPDAPPLGEGVPLTVSLNGQQFSASSDFLAFAPHNLTLTAPASGPFAGGTLVNVSLDGAAHNATDGALCRWRRRRGRRDPAERRRRLGALRGAGGGGGGGHTRVARGLRGGCPTARSRSAPRASTAASCSSRRSRAAAPVVDDDDAEHGGLGALDHDGSAPRHRRARRGDLARLRPAARRPGRRRRGPGSLH